MGVAGDPFRWEFDSAFKKPQERPESPVESPKVTQDGH